ncbi:MAG TPA: MraY family glycosyltransferase [Bacilli bacterium]|nr:MraY family glycosyltransferase [Bacilli bacterium]
MFESIGIKESLIIISSVLLFTALTMILVKKIAIHIKAVDVPNQRKVHTTIMPRLGGLGIFLGFLFGTMLCGFEGRIYEAILISGFLIVILGMIDDIKPLKASTKLAGQLVVACVLMLYGNILLKEISIFGLYINFYWGCYILTPLFIVAIINAMNLIDGLDGLLAGTSSIFFITVIILSLLTPKLGTMGLELSLVMLGATLGFLIHNFYPAKIFAGDSGSMFIGMMIAIISLLGFKTATVTSLMVPIIIIGIPIIDTICAVIRRLINKQPVYLPDKNHLHHQLLSMGLSHRNTVLALYLMNALFATASILYFTKNKMVGKYIYIAIFLVVVWIFTKTSIIKKQKNKK